MQITLTDELEQQLRQYAGDHALQPETLALEVLREWCGTHPLSDSSPQSVQTLEHFLDGYIGAVSSGDIVSGGANMSVGYKQKIADGMAEKRRQGRL